LIAVNNQEVAVGRNQVTGEDDQVDTAGVGRGRLTNVPFAGIKGPPFSS
jgi:hypothetical protein